ncbi:nuclear transport factor 2 family protein [Pseudalkalibacillus caeni]|uniref:DUF4440 domain-containing protein n=1 Tax=Exobacillus caeni TaxID=2574798 RepID=A0A5R9EXR3_9BACL|nr:nuclear transport factor 2 family protein [Pseudalkalibacillus caeni]TLS36072.1 DUF4440 domain-containing protein [Pseudalkalibacillus caeni]
MNEQELKDFKQFLKVYRKDWNSCDASAVMSHCSKDLKVRWAGPDTAVSDWGYAEAESGWKQAYEMYEGKNPGWHFEDVLTEINSEGEGMAVFWVRFEQEGKVLEQKKLFTETFRKENGSWKKIREYVEVNIPELIPSTL